MKKNNIMILVALIAFPFFFSACKKKTDDPAPESTCTTLLAQEDIVVTGGSYPGTQKRVYKYNSNKHLVKIEYTYSPNTTYSSYDTIIYNGSNQIASLKSYNVGNGTANQTVTYYSTGSRIDSVREVNAGATYDKTTKFTYTSGVLSAQHAVYHAGSGGGGPDDIASIVFTNGNITSGDLGSSFGGPVTITNETTAPNPYFGLNNQIDILLMFDRNNATSAYSNAVPGVLILSQSYTYSDGKVHTITDDDGNGGTRVNTLTYICL